MKQAEPKVKMFLGGQEITGSGSWKLSTVPWYLKPWYWFKMRRIYRTRNRRRVKVILGNSPK